MKAKMNRHTWTASDTAELQRRFPVEHTARLASSMGLREKQVISKAKAMGLRKSPAYMSSPAAGRTDGKRGEKTRFQPGMTPWNKGLSWDSGGRSHETRFKPGTTPPNRREVGSLRVNSEGYIDIKTSPGARAWVPLHRWNWRLAHGEYPPRGMALVFKDGNRHNCDIGNLELISRSQLMSRNTVHNYPKEIAELVQLRGAITRQINKREVKTA